MATILVAEDEEAIRSLLFVILKAGGHQVVAAANGVEAVALYRSSPDRFDLVITDIKMPVMDGIESTRRIKSIYPDMPIIAQSAYSLPEERNLAFAAGCFEFITKPIKAENLFTAIKKVQMEILPTIPGSCE
jgi:CheY-like chemotaxis protein